jgi:hypothetical protein
MQQAGLNSFLEELVNVNESTPNNRSKLLTSCREYSFPVFSSRLCAFA